MVAGRLQYEETTFGGRVFCGGGRGGEKNERPASDKTLFAALSAAAELGSAARSPGKGRRMTCRLYPKSRRTAKIRRATLTAENDERRNRLRRHFDRYWSVSMRSARRLDVAIALVDHAFLPESLNGKNARFRELSCLCTVSLFFCKRLLRLSSCLFRPTRSKRQICFSPRFLRLNRPYPFLFKAIASYRI